MLESNLGRGPLGSVVGEKGTDEKLSVLANSVPDTVIEGEGTGADLVHDVLVGLAVEGGHAGEEDEGDDTGGPDIALLVVALVEDLGGNVVRGSEFLVQLTVSGVDEGGAEVDDLDLVELLVGLEKDVLRLEIAMDDVDLVAVVDAREDLLHEDRGVTLRELTLGKDFVEELTTLANSAEEERRD